MSVAVEFNLKTPNMTNRREHHMARARRQKKQRAVTTMVLKANRVAERLRFGPLIVTLTRKSPGTLDAHDNLRSALKSVVDAVAAYFGVDDAGPWLEWRYAQAKGPHAVRIDFAIDAGVVNVWPESRRE